jgi:hypothetical protein
MNSLLKAFHYLIDPVRSELKHQWRSSKFSITPTERNFLESEWHKYRGNLRMNKALTPLEYLDNLVREIRTELPNPSSILRIYRPRRFTHQLPQPGRIRKRTRYQIPVAGIYEQYHP